MQAEFTIEPSQSPAPTADMVTNTNKTTKPTASTNAPKTSTRTFVRPGASAAATNLEVNNYVSPRMDPASQETETESGPDTFFSSYNAVLNAQQKQTDLLQTLHTEHAKAIKKVNNLASRRKQRIESLEHENTALRRSLGHGRAAFEDREELEENLLSTRRTVDMLTKDLSAWEAKYKTSQDALRAITQDAETFERKWRTAEADTEKVNTQITAVRGELGDAQGAIKNGSKQLRGLQRVLRKVDKVIVERVRELARLSGEWDRNGGADERLRSKVANEMTELVKVWNDFEVEYDEGTIGGVGEAVHK